MPEYRFTLSGATFPEGGDPLGLWQPSESPVSFAAGSAVSADGTPPAGPIWRVELPASLEGAQQILESRMHALKRARGDLLTATEELDRLSVGRGVSFGTSEELAAQKAALLETVDELRRPVSFGILPKRIKDPESYRQWQAFVEQVRQVIAHYAQIETALAGSTVGLTTVGWTGDCATTWAPDITVDTMQTHVMSVRLTLESRVALMRVVSVVATGAAGLAVKAAIPGGQLLLLPAIWKFVRDVLAELRQSWPKLRYLG
jgi:hypothetical protein